MLNLVLGVGVFSLLPITVSYANYVQSLAQKDSLTRFRSHASTPTPVFLRGTKLRPWSEQNTDQNSDHARLCNSLEKEKTQTMVYPEEDFFSTN